MTAVLASCKKTPNQNTTKIFKNLSSFCRFIIVAGKPARHLFPVLFPMHCYIGCVRITCQIYILLREGFLLFGAFSTKICNSS